MYLFHLLVFAFYLYTVWRLIIPLPLSRDSRAFLAFVLLLITQYRWFELWFLGSMFSPELPHNVVLILGGLFAGFSVLIMLTLLSDIVSLIGSIFSIHSLYWSTRKRVVIF